MDYGRWPIWLQDLFQVHDDCRKSFGTLLFHGSRAPWLNRSAPTIAEKALNLKEKTRAKMLRSFQFNITGRRSQPNPLKLVQNHHKLSAYCFPVSWASHLLEFIFTSHKHSNVDRQFLGFQQITINSLSLEGKMQAG